MTYKTHIAGGLLLSAIYLVSANVPVSPTNLCVAAGAGALGSLVPDIDHPDSKISKAAKPVSIIADAISVHRGMFHAPLPYLAIWLAWTLLFPAAPLFKQFLFVGIFSHLLLDMLNPAGIPVFWPVKQKHFRLAKIKTGGKREVIFRYMLWVLFAALIAFKILF